MTKIKLPFGYRVARFFLQFFPAVCTEIYNYRRYLWGCRIVGAKPRAFSAWRDSFLNPNHSEATR
jgi:hypothetical protein